jgi:hypothetical protein
MAFKENLFKTGGDSENLRDLVSTQKEFDGLSSLNDDDEDAP